MATRVNTIHLSPVNPDDQITSRPCTVDFADGTTPQLQIDMIDPAATFTAEDGAIITVTALGDVNVMGPGPVLGGPFPYTVQPTPPPPPPPPTSVPGPVTVLGVSSV